MNKVFNSKCNTLTVRHGKICDYLRMTLYYSLHDRVNITMFDDIEGFISKIPYYLKGNSVNAAPNHLLEVGYDSPMLHPTDEKI